MKLQNLLNRKGFVTIKLKKINTNHFIFKAKLNGVNGVFILDTGASNSCLDIGLADDYKLQVEDSKTKAAGAGASGMDTKIANNNTLQIGKWLFKNFTLVLIDLNHVNTALTEHNAESVHGIIGADILEKGHAIIDYKKRRLYLKKLVYKF